MTNSEVITFQFMTNPDIIISHSNVVGGHNDLHTFPTAVCLICRQHIAVNELWNMPFLMGLKQMWHEIKGVIFTTALLLCQWKCDNWRIGWQTAATALFSILRIWYDTIDLKICTHNSQKEAHWYWKIQILVELF